ncbi:SPOR domain-containing protein [Psychroflexus tropicus]|uniref:SPOR domain-containing protein n=1 Tax=Psychroflexus tropicus TaxID=197345 RepID=UPI00035EA3FF|nr:SPOR domain-containing protein [Psychroflexus tropicus]
MSKIFNILAPIIFFFAATFNQFAQSKLTSTELTKVDELINKKHELESNYELKTTYKIQIFSGALEKAKESQQVLEAMELDLTSKIVYQTPNYKVWIGSFRNRIQADRVKEQIKSEYPNALIIKPGK